MCLLILLEIFLIFISEMFQPLLRFCEPVFFPKSHVFKEPFPFFFTQSTVRGDKLNTLGPTQFSKKKVVFPSPSDKERPRQCPKWRNKKVLNVSHDLAVVVAKVWHLHKECTFLADLLRPIVRWGIGDSFPPSVESSHTWLCACRFCRAQRETLWTHLPRNTPLANPLKPCVWLLSLQWGGLLSWSRGFSALTDFTHRAIDCHFLSWPHLHRHGQFFNAAYFLQMYVWYAYVNHAEVIENITKLEKGGNWKL